MKKKSQKSENKFLRTEEVEELRKMSSQDLLKNYLKENKALRIKNRKHKEDSEIKDLKEQIKKHRETTVPEKTLKEIAELKARLKEIKDEVDEGIQDLKAELKELNKDHNNDKGASKEKIKLIQSILDGRDS